MVWNENFTKMKIYEHLDFQYVFESSSSILFPYWKFQYVHHIDNDIHKSYLGQASFGNISDATKDLCIWRNIEGFFKLPLSFVNLREFLENFRGNTSYIY